jgi:hypothetical protein
MLENGDPHPRASLGLFIDGKSARARMGRALWGLGLCLAVSGCTGPATDFSSGSDANTTESVSQLQASSYQDGFAAGQLLQAQTDRADTNTAAAQAVRSARKAEASAYSEGVAEGKASQAAQDRPLMAASSASPAALAAARQAGFTQGEAAGRQTQTQSDQAQIEAAQDTVAQAKAASAASPSTADQLAQQAVQETLEMQQISRLCHVAPPDTSLDPNALP